MICPKNICFYTKLKHIWSIRMKNWNFFSHIANRNVLDLLCQNSDNRHVYKISDTHTRTHTFHDEQVSQFCINRIYSTQQHYQTARKCVSTIYAILRIWYSSDWLSRHPNLLLSNLREIHNTNETPVILVSHLTEKSLWVLTPSHCSMRGGKASFIGDPSQHLSFLLAHFSYYTIYVRFGGCGAFGGGV